MKIWAMVTCLAITFPFSVQGSIDVSQVLYSFGLIIKFLRILDSPMKLQLFKNTQAYSIQIW
jgi:hypothetical protein